MLAILNTLRVKKHANKTLAVKQQTNLYRKRKKPNEEVTRNGLVKCNLCNFEWNGHAQHDCTYMRE